MMSLIMDKQQTEFNKKIVRSHFDRAANSYDKAAVLQREVADRLLERLDYVIIEPEIILDVGAGTGYLASGLKGRYKKAHVIEMDLSMKMLLQGAKKSPWYRQLMGNKCRVCGDAEQLPYANESVDCLISSLTIQWCNNLQQTFSEFKRVLKPGGLLMFTTFGPDTLKELRESWADVDEQGHVSAFLDMHDVGDSLLHAGLSEPVMDVEHFTLTYPAVGGLVKDLRDIGATNALQQRAQGLTGKQAYQAMVQAYEKFRTQGQLPASYEVIYGHAWKGLGQSKPINPQYEIPVS